MKKIILSTTLFMLLAAVFIGCPRDVEIYPEFEIWEDKYCEKTPPSFYPIWNNKDEDGNYVYYAYFITQAPEKYKAYEKKSVFYIYNQIYHGDMWNKSNKKKILNALRKGDIQEFEMNGMMYLAVTTVKND